MFLKFALISFIHLRLVTAYSTDKPQDKTSWNILNTSKPPGFMFIQMLLHSLSDVKLYYCVLFYRLHVLMHLWKIQYSLSVYQFFFWLTYSLKRDLKKLMPLQYKSNLIWNEMVQATAALKTGHFVLSF